MKTSDQELVICDMCPYCEEEVELYSIGLQQCPRCGLHFTPSEEAGRSRMKMWIARNSDNTLELFKVKPKTFYEEGIGQYWAGGYAYFLPANQFPEVTFEKSPIEVELVIKK